MNSSKNMTKVNISLFNEFIESVVLLSKIVKIKSFNYIGNQWIGYHTHESPPIGPRRLRVGITLRPLNANNNSIIDEICYDISGAGPGRMTGSELREYMREILLNKKETTLK